MRMEASKSLIFPLILAIFTVLGSSSDYTNLVFKGCADRDFPNSGYKETLKVLLKTLTSQSSTAKFYKTSSGTAINGLFQCRGDLSGDSCNRCVKRSAFMAHGLCGSAAAVRVHLSGCYLRYEIAGFRQASRTDSLYRVCGSTRASWAGFEDRLETALGEIVKGVGVSGDFYAGVYQNVYVLGQCEGDLGSGDCVECVKNAIDRVVSECGSSISAQVYLQECYISYAYYPNGVPTNQKSLPSSSVEGNGRKTQKTVAIVLGVLVGVGLLMACMLFTKSVFKKKKTHTYKYGG